jgi:hypothetical protein
MYPNMYLFKARVSRLRFSIFGMYVKYTKYKIQSAPKIHNFDLVFEILMFKKSGRGLINLYFIYVFRLIKQNQRNNVKCYAWKLCK